MLKMPNTDIDFIVTPEYFLSPFDIYDREESLGVELNKFDPNDINDLKFLFEKYVFSGVIVDQFQEEHKLKIINTLSDILESAEINFVEIIESLQDLDNPIFLPSNWVFEEPKLFFEEAYNVATSLWG